MNNLGSVEKIFLKKNVSLRDQTDNEIFFIHQ